MMQKLKKKLSGIAFCILVGCILPNSLLSAADNIAVSNTEYSLTVENLPEGVSSRAYAKLHDADADASEYSLSLFDGYDAMIAMEEALENAGENLSEIQYQAMEIILYQEDEEGDFYPVEEAGGITLICPVPESFSGNTSSIQVTAVGSGGTLMRIPSDLVTVNGVTCVRFDISKAEIYAFLVKQGGQLTTGIVPTATPTPTRAVSRPTPTPTKAAAQPTPAPTKAAAQPTPAPTKAAAQPTPVPTKAAAQPTPAPTKVTGQQTATPTKAASANQSTAQPTRMATQPVRDYTPQTGDDFDRSGYLMLFGAGAVMFGAIAVIYMKKK